MFHSHAVAPCRLTARRRLALGGLVLTTTLAAGALVSTPAFAVGATEISSFGDLHRALHDHDQDLVLTADLDSSDEPDVSDPLLAYDLETIAVSTTLDLNGHELRLNRIAVAAAQQLTVTNSRPDFDPYSGSGLYVSAPAQSDLPGTATAVDLGDGATLEVDGADVWAVGTEEGAGIGSHTGDISARVVAEGGATVRGDGGSDGGAGIGGSSGTAGVQLTVQGDGTQVAAYGGDGASGIGGGEDAGGGDVHILGGSVQAHQGDRVDPGPNVAAASAIGAGESLSALDFGLLEIAAGGSLALSDRTPLRVPAGSTVVNAGVISLSRDAGGDDFAMTGDGRVANAGSIETAEYDTDGNRTEIDPWDLVDLSVTGNNYVVSADVAGGGIVDADDHAVAAPTLRRFLGSTLTELFGGSYSVTAPSDTTTFWRWTTGSGATVSDALSVAGTSTGTPVPVELTAHYARLPYATATTLPDAVVGTPYRAALPVAGDGLDDYSAYSSTDPDHPVPGLPAGLSIDPATGVISGTPTEAADRDVFFEVGGVGYAAVTLHITVGGTPVFATGALAAGTVGSAYSSTLAVGGSAATTYAVVGGGLPAGLALNAATGAITGTPTAAAGASFTVRATNRFGSTDRAFTLSIAAAAATAPAASAPVVASVPRTTVKIGHQVTLAVTASSTAPVTYAVVRGSLPKGVTLNGATGLIGGSPAAAGTFTASVEVTSSAGSATTTVVIVVPELVDLISTKNAVPAVTVGAAAVPLKVAGLQKGERWTVKVDGEVVQRGTMKKAGPLSVRVHLKKAAKDRVHTIRIAGSRKVADPSKQAATEVTVTSLAAKKALTVHTVSANGVRLVAVERLAAGERVVVKDGRRVVAKGHASASGIFTFPQTKAGAGISTLKVTGAAAKRAGRLTVKNPKH